jgi:hypothetical protein
MKPRSDAVTGEVQTTSELCFGDPSRAPVGSGAIGLVEPGERSEGGRYDRNAERAGRNGVDQRLCDRAMPPQKRSCLQSNLI